MSVLHDVVGVVVGPGCRHQAVATATAGWRLERWQALPLFGRNERDNGE